VNSRTSPFDRSKILADLRSLRDCLADARNALMHYKDDRVDRDKLEPAARRVDDLMIMFAGSGADVAKGTIWVNEIQTGIDRVINPKSAAALLAARAGTEELLTAMAPAANGAHSRVN
jgi:hypothetical protein